MEPMTILTSDHLIDAGVESLHSESVEWIRELNFWVDETRFLHSLLQQMSRSRFPDERAAEVDRDLIKWRTEALELTKEGIINHERLLMSSLRTASKPDEQIYREAHRKLQEDMRRLGHQIRELKKSVFQLIP